MPHTLMGWLVLALYVLASASAGVAVRLIRRGLGR